uniref:Uncharacterized protein n=1 Tax=uncultured marine virus TaxID=186617 RepID=A0A0F7L0D2_9VIRU|nr:hypothetical protein [uncultured marine virus]
MYSSAKRFASRIACAREENVTSSPSFFQSWNRSLDSLISWRLPWRKISVPEARLSTVTTPSPAGLISTMRFFAGFAAL